MTLQLQIMARNKMPYKSNALSFRQRLVKRERAFSNIPDNWYDVNFELNMEAIAFEKTYQCKIEGC